MDLNRLFFRHDGTVERGLVMSKWECGVGNFQFVNESRGAISKNS